MSIIKQDYGTMYGGGEHLIAPVQINTVAKQNYAVGQEFIYENVLYKVTKSGGISQGSAIDMANDVVVADTVIDQVKGAFDTLEGNSARVILTLTKVDAESNFSIYRTNNILLGSSRIVVPPGTYTVSVKYGDYYYAPLGYCSGSNLDTFLGRSFSSSKSVGEVVTFGYSLYMTWVTISSVQTVGGLTQTNFYLIKTASDRWDFILPVSALRSSTKNASITTTTRNEAIILAYIMQDTIAPIFPSI